MKRALTIQFDGGAEPNPGKGYGSWQVSLEGKSVLRRERVAFGDRLTNNEAEYLSLISALSTLRSVVRPDGERLRLLSDSALLVNQISRRWRVKHPNMKRLAAEATRLLIGYTWTAEWIPRERNVALFGH